MCKMPSMTTKQIEHEEVLSLDIGGSKLALAMVNRRGDLLNHVRRPTAQVHSGDDISKWVGEVVSEWKASPTAMGISTGGPLDDERGMVTRMPRMEMLWDFPLADRCKQLVPSLERVLMVNDANAACAGEVVFGAARGLTRALYLTISTGIGGGAVVSGLLLRGDKGNVAEFGHMCVEPGGPRCDCGAAGCLEEIASASGIYRRCVEAKLLKAQARGWADLGPWLIERLSAKDPAVIAIWQRALTGLAIGLVNLWNCFVPQAIVLGGGLSALVQESKADLKRLIDERSHLMPMPEGIVRFSENRHHIPLLGAAAVAGNWIGLEQT